MNCKKAENLILSGTTDEKLEGHIASCAECRNIASVWASLKDVRPTVIPEPPRYLDFKIRGAAVAFLDNRKISYRVFTHRIFMYATAACCVVVTWFALDSIGTQNKTERGNFVRSGAISWSNIDMEKDFFELTTELELSIQNIYSGDNTDNDNEKDGEDSIPDLST
jgi:hypothetical protein